MHLKINSLLLLFIISLVGCATTDDPREGGFISGVSSIVTGAYDTRLDERQNELTKAKTLKNKLQKNSADAMEQKTQVEHEINLAKHQLLELSHDTQKLIRQIESKKINVQLSGEQRSLLLREIKELDSEVKLLSTDNLIPIERKKIRIKELIERKQSLTNTLQQVLQM